MNLVAIKPMRYRNVHVNPDEEFSATERDGRLLKAIGKAKDALDEPAQRKEEKAEMAPELNQVADKPKRAYKRRDMKAED